MVTASACACLALALAFLPGSPAPARLRPIGPQRTGSARRHRHLPATALVAAGALAGFLAAGPGGALAAAVVVAMVRMRHRRRAGDAAGAAMAGEVADALRRITDELRTGAHPAAALGGVYADGPLAAAVLADAAAAARLGDDVPRALRRAADARPAVAGALTRIAQSWSLAERHGIPLADLLSRAQSDIAWRVQYGRRVHAQLAGPRATATVLTALPALGLLLGQLLGADPVAVLRHGVLGQVLLVVGVGLSAIGFIWTDRILHSAAAR